MSLFAGPYGDVKSGRPVFELYLDGTGHGKVMLDGKELPYTTAVSIDARVGEPTRVSLEIIAPELCVKLDGVDFDEQTKHMLLKPKDSETVR